ncbi:MAG: dihydroorotase [Firmicutes bacterium]|nr:dihydroorotase [Bacillota bacterium]
MSILIKNGQVVLLDKVIKADILIEGSRIKKIAPNIEINADELIDASGKIIMPGLVDMHAHLRDPGFLYKEDIVSGIKSAAAGGYTSIACMPNTDPVIDNEAIVKYIQTKAAEIGTVKVYPIACITKGMKGLELAEMGKLKEAGVIAFSDDGRPVENAMLMKNALSYAKSHDALVISHCEDLSIASGGLVNEGFNATTAGLKGICRSAEEIIVARDLILAEHTGARVHIAHVSTEGSVNLIREAKYRGVKVTAETCPHYFAATDEEVSSFNTFAKINPPLRTANDINAIIKGLKDGTIDCIATDHAPHSLDEKRQEFGYAPFGTIGFESAFAISYTHLVDDKHIDLPHLIRLMSYTPAKILGLNAGEVKEGELADLIIADINQLHPYAIDACIFKSKARNCIFDGWKVKGKILITIINGEIV